MTRLPTRVPSLPAPPLANTIGGYRGNQPGDPYTDRGGHKRTAIRGLIVDITTNGWDQPIAGKMLAIRGLNANSTTMVLKVTINEQDVLYLHPNASEPAPWKLTLGPLAFYRVKLEALQTDLVTPTTGQVTVTWAENALISFDLSPG